MFADVNEDFSAQQNVTVKYSCIPAKCTIQYSNYMLRGSTLLVFTSPFSFCPLPLIAWRMQDRNHARPHSQERQDW